jgi:hypothetical protein
MLPLPLEFQLLALPGNKIAIGLAGTPAVRVDIDQCSLGPGMAEQRPGRLDVFGVLVDIGVPAEMPELVRRHVHAEIALDSRDDLNGDGVLVSGVHGDEISPRVR